MKAPPLPNTEQSSDHHHNRTAITEECDFPDIEALTALKVCTSYEYHREGALEGCEPARIWLIEEYPGCDRMPWKMVSVQLRPGANRSSGPAGNLGRNFPDGARYSAG